MGGMLRWVLHLDMDAFFASCEQLTRPTLRGRPVLVGGRSGRGVVAGASYEARKYGARSAMPVGRATRLIGYSAVVIPPRKEVYSVASKRVFEVLHAEVDVVEQLSIDEGYMEPRELVGASEVEVRRWAEALRAKIKEVTGLPCSIGAGSGKQFAKIASDEAKPDGVYVIPHDKELDWLHPLDVGKLWGVGPVSRQKLQALGIDTVGDLAGLRQVEAESILGVAMGTQLWELAQGIDERPVQPRAEAKSVSAEHTYHRDLLTKVQVNDAVERAAADAHRRLLADGRGARTVSVKLRMADFRIESRSATLPYATDDAKLLLAIALRLTRYPEEVGPIRLVGVGYSGLEAERQNVLFPELDAVAVRSRAGRAEETYEVGVAGVGSDDGLEVTTEVELPHTGWRPGDDVSHPDFGHGWVQGAGSGVVTVRFESRSTPPGKARTFAADDPLLEAADPLDSLDWEDWLGSVEPEDEEEPEL